MKKRYVSKQEAARRQGRTPGTKVQQMHARAREEAPMYEILKPEVEAAPIVNSGGLRRRLLHTPARR